MADGKDDIEKYRNGELSPKEMHALEKRALQDPFLADALEGAESISPENFSDDLTELQESIDFQSEENMAVSMDQAAAPAMEVAARGRLVASKQKIINKWTWPLRIAASLFIIIGALWTANQLIPNGGKENLALKKEEAKPEPAQSSAASSMDSVVNQEKEISTSQPKSNESLALKSTKKPAEIIIEKPAIKETLKNKIEEEPIPLAEVVKSKEELKEEISEDRRAADVKDEKITEAPSVALAKKDAYGAASRSKELKKVRSERQQMIQGQVISAEDGTPLPGVNVLVQGTTEGAVTDANGNYQLPAVGADQKLTFSFIGYLTQEVPVTDQNKIDVKLGSDVSQLSEVVVVGYGYQNDSDKEPVIKEAQPAGGRKAYDKYLDNSLRYPVEALNNKIKGKVTVKFTVRTDGALDEFSVVKSIGHGCDEEVIRLVKEGPKWSPTTEDNVPVESEVLVKVRFDPTKAKR
jgi:TonB family protein